MSKIDKNGNIDITPTSPHLKDGAKHGSFKEKRPFRDNTSRAGVGGLLSVFIIVLFIISFSNYIRTGQFVEFSFNSLLDFLSNFPQVDFNRFVFDLTIYSDWSVFNFLRDFINFFTDFLELLIMFTGWLWQLIKSFFYCVRVLFI